MSDHWNTYMTFYKDKPVSIVLDMEPWGEGANERLVHLYQLNIQLNNANENGLTINKEADVLNSIEDSINDSLGGNYANVGRVTTNGIRNIYFYTDSNDGSELEKAASKYLVDYRFRVKRIEEQKPSDFYYEFLYPNKFEKERMGNGQLVRNLINLGDNLTQSRKVNHWIYFDSLDSRKKFKDKVHTDGFYIEDEEYQKDTYSLRISRNDFVQLNSINDVTDYLVSVAEECNGNYDGWETEVIKKPKNIMSKLKDIFKPK